MILDPLAEELSWEERFAVFNVFVRVCAIPEKEKMEEESPTGEDSSCHVLSNTCVVM